MGLYRVRIGYIQRVYGDSGKENRNSRTFWVQGGLGLGFKD